MSDQTPQPLPVIAPSPDVPPDLPPMQSDSPAPTTEPEGPQFKFWWYCMEEHHPGVPSYGSQPLDVRRIFGTETDQGCPRCPACQREVSSAPCLGPTIPPASIVEYASRFAASQIQGGIGR